MVMLFAVPSLADKTQTADSPELAFLEFLAEMEEFDDTLVAPVDLLADESTDADHAQREGDTWLSLWRLLNSTAMPEAANTPVTEPSQAEPQQ